MSSAVSSSSRPSSLRRWTKVLVVVLAILAIEAVWDYVEARRVRDAIRGVQASGAPTSEAQINAVPTGRDSDASSLYAAAGHLAARSSAATAAIGRELTAALSSDSVNDVLLARVAEHINGQSEALRLLDGATALPFSRFRARDRYTGLAAALTNLYDLAAIRTLHDVLTHQGDAAVRSLTSEMVLVGPSGPMEETRVVNRYPTVDRLALAMPDLSATELAAIAAPLAAAVGEHELEHQLTVQRARAIDTFMSTAAYRSGFTWRFFQRPLAAHLFVADLHAYGDKSAAVRAAWPAPIASTAVALPGMAGRLNGWPRTAVGLPPTVIEQIVIDIAAYQAGVAAVAVQRYRLAHDGALPAGLNQLGPDLPTVPVDPFSGSPLLFRSSASEFVVYSVGPDRTDNGGDLRRGNLLGDPMVGAGVHRGPDIGVRVSLGRQ